MSIIFMGIHTFENVEKEITAIVSKIDDTFSVQLHDDKAGKFIKKTIHGLTEKGAIEQAKEWSGV